MTKPRKFDFQELFNDAEGWTTYWSERLKLEHEEVVYRLKQLRRKWRTEATRRQTESSSIGDPLTRRILFGSARGLRDAADDVDGLIKEMEEWGKSDD